MDESIKDLQNEKGSSIPLDSSKDDKKEKVLPVASNSVEALQALQLMVKDIANIKDPAEASAARKECYGFYRKILDLMEPVETLQIREDSKRFMKETSLKTTREFVGSIGTLVLFLLTLSALALNLLSSESFILEVLLLVSVAFFSIVTIVRPFFDMKWKK